MKILIADKFSEKHIDRLNKLSCEITYNPGIKAELAADTITAN